MRRQIARRGHLGSVIHWSPRAHKARAISVHPRRSLAGRPVRKRATRIVPAVSVMSGRGSDGSRQALTVGSKINIGEPTPTRGFIPVSGLLKIFVRQQSGSTGARSNP
eukprot:9667543-Heterocapsa_arctica.AAC.1